MSAIVKFPFPIVARVFDFSYVLLFAYLIEAVFSFNLLSSLKLLGIFIIFLYLKAK
ncbi:hypothetical protein AEBR_2127 [Halarcobacter ebronensis]|nr:hypothetical protein AEBR_2127 [Halarcobacter ebronensis]